MVEFRDQTAGPSSLYKPIPSFFAALLCAALAISKPNLAWARDPGLANLLALAEEAGFNRPPLTVCESRLLKAVAIGTVEDADCGHDPGAPAPKESGGSLQPYDVRAKLIRWLIVDPKAVKLVDSRGIRLYRARVVDELNLSFLTVPFPLVFGNCTFTHRIDIRNARAPMLDFEGSWVTGIAGDSITVATDVFLRHGFQSAGEVNLAGATIGGDLDCVRGTFNSPKGYALNLKRVDVTGDVFLSDRFSAKGEVTLNGANIGGDLNCGGGTFSNPPGDALSAHGIDVSGDVLLSDGLHGFGAVRLTNATIGGNLDCGAGIFDNAGGFALDAANIRVKRNILLDGTLTSYTEKPFYTNGYVRLDGANIEGTLYAYKAEFAGTSSFEAERATVKGAFIWRDLKLAPGVRIDLSDATVKTLDDDWPTDWPPGNLDLEGFTYSRFGTRSDVSSRLKWLGRQGWRSRLSRQPYEQLAKVLREAGDPEGATAVLVAMEHTRYQSGSPWQSLITGPILHWSVGYGYKPQWAFYWSVAVVLFGWGIFRYGYKRGAIAPYHPLSYEISKAPGGRVPRYDPPFSPFGYSLDNFLPIADLRQKGRWMPDLHSEKRIFGKFELGWWLRFYLWIHTLLGWLLSSLFLGVITGIIH
jgi:hypothetical protein